MPFVINYHQKMDSRYFKEVRLIVFADSEEQISKLWEEFKNTFYYTDFTFEDFLYSRKIEWRFNNTDLTLY